MVRIRVSWNDFAGEAAIRDAVDMASAFVRQKVAKVEPGEGIRSVTLEINGRTEVITPLSDPDEVIRRFKK